MVIVDWIGLDWVSQLVDWVGLDLAKWTHVQLWSKDSYIYIYECFGIDNRYAHLVLNRLLTITLAEVVMCLYVSLISERLLTV